MKAFVVATVVVASIASALASPYYAPALQVYPNGAVAPVETPEVQAEKAKHFQAHAEQGGYPFAHYSHAGYAHGLPADTPEVAHAKAEHFAAVAKAKAAIAHAGPSHHDDGHYVHAEPAYHGAYTGPAYHGPYHIPHIVNGVPVEPAEVQHARAAHFAAVSKAQAESGYGGHYEDAGHYDDGSYKHHY